VSKKEAVLQKRIIDYIKTQGGYTVKVITATRSGVPDIIACYKGKFIGIEVKTPKGKVSSLQQQNLDSIKATGGLTVVARTLEDVASLMRVL